MPPYAETLTLDTKTMNPAPLGSSGEHSEAVGGKWDISNKQRLGFSEVELVQKMIDGVTPKPTALIQALNLNPSPQLESKPSP